jgi:hypothetical protein
MKHSAHKKNPTASNENLYDDPKWGQDSHNSKRKAPTSKKELQAIRNRYTWHLREPGFNHVHWWSRYESADYKRIDPLAAFYEVARRHPKITEIPHRPFIIPGDVHGEALLKWYNKLTLPEFVRFLSHNAMRSWKKLTNVQQERWKHSIGKLKSFDQRSNDSISGNLTYSTYIALLHAQEERDRQTRETMPPELAGFSFLGWFLFPAQDAWEKAISEDAVKAHREGRVLIAVEPHLTAEKAVAAMKQAYFSHPYVDSSPVTRERVRCQQWLEIIAAFEDSTADETIPAKVNSQLFVRYRRIIDQKAFPACFISAGEALRRPARVSYP